MIFADNPCVLEGTGQQSTCQRLSDCPEAQYQLQLNKKKHLQLCGFENSEYIVCCPPTRPARQPGVISKISEYTAIFSFKLYNYVDLF